MKQIITPIFNKTVEILKTTRATILPFTERPSEENKGLSDDKEACEEINATELFAIFTADIIKQKVLFTR